MLELLLTLLVLYGLQCAILLPRGCTLWLRLGGEWRHSSGPGWRLLHPWPSAWSWVQTGLPILQTEEGLRAIGPTPWLGSAYAGRTGPLLEPGRAVEVKGSRVLVDGEPAARGVTPAHARAVAEVFERISSGEAGAYERALAEFVSEAGAAFAADRERVDAATRWLGAFADVSLVSFFGVLPALAFWLGDERALLFFGPAYAVLHLATLVTLALAHRKLLPDDGDDRFETVLTAALYPPALLRSVQGLRLRLLGARGDLMAAGVLPSEEVRAWIRRALQRDPGDRRAKLVADALGVRREALFGPPPREDELSKSYCPGCRTEYRIDTGACTDCGAALETF